MKVLIWLVEGTWEGCVAAARALLPADAEVTLVYVADAEVPEAADGAMAGLLGRGRPGRDPGRRIAALSQTAAAQLLEAPPAGSAARRGGCSAPGGSSARWWSRPPAPTCWWPPATATAPGWDLAASAPQPASWWTTLPDRCCWYGPTRCPNSTPCRLHQ